MYHVIGSDQKEYGPVSAAQIRQWFAEGRLHRGLAARPENETEWKTLGTLAEFAGLFPPPPGLTPPKPVTTENCGLATASLICGALGVMLCVTAPIGLVLGFMAHSRMRASNGRLTGSGLATTGIVLSLIGLVVIPATVLLPALSRTGQKVRAVTCVANLKQLDSAVRVYATGNQEQYPPSKTWCDAIQATVGSPRVFQCPTALDQRCGYAFNARLGGRKLSEVNPQTVVIFESDAGWNANGGSEFMLHQPRHRRHFLVGFANGHIEQVPEARLDQLRWKP